MSAGREFGDLDGPIINITGLATFAAIPLYLLVLIFPARGESPFGP